jgi:four helix bundle protein
MARPKNFHGLIVWQRAMQLAKQAYRLAEGLPRKEAFGLIAQIQRAAVSVPSNIAEGHGRLTDLQFRHFLGNARGSLSELQTQIELAEELGYLNDESTTIFMEQAEEVARLLNGLIASLTRVPRQIRAIATTATNAAAPAISANTANTALKGLK